MLEGVAHGVGFVIGCVVTLVGLVLFVRLVAGD